MDTCQTQGCDSPRTPGSHYCWAHRESPIDLEDQLAALRADNEALRKLFAALPFVTISRYRATMHKEGGHADDADTCLEQPCAAMTDILGERAAALALLDKEAPRNA